LTRHQASGWNAIDSTPVDESGVVGGNYGLDAEGGKESILIDRIKDKIILLTIRMIFTRLGKTAF
jgi:hypothetical protein